MNKPPSRIRAIALVLGVAAALIPFPASAAKKDGPRFKFFEKYDKNHNGVIDEDEKAAIRKDYAEKPDGDLKRFDKNKDGNLDNEELAAIKPPTGKKRGEKDKAEKPGSTNQVERASVAVPSSKTNQIEKAAAPQPRTDKEGKPEKKDSP